MIPALFTHFATFYLVWEKAILEIHVWMTWYSSSLHHFFLTLGLPCFYQLSLKREKQSKISVPYMRLWNSKPGKQLCLYLDKKWFLAANMVKIQSLVSIKLFFLLFLCHYNPGIRCSFNLHSCVSNVSNWMTIERIYFFLWLMADEPLSKTSINEKWLFTYLPVIFSCYSQKTFWFFKKWCLVKPLSVWQRQKTSFWDMYLIVILFTKNFGIFQYFITMEHQRTVSYSCQDWLHFFFLIFLSA